MRRHLTRCTIRSFDPADAAALARCGDSRAIWINMRDRFPSPFTLPAAEDWIRRALADVPEPSFAIDVGGEVAGAVWFHLQDDISRHSAELGYFLGEAYQGRGLGAEVIAGATEHAFDTLGLTRMFAITFDFNTASMRVLEKAGFTREAVMRQAAVKEGKVVDEVMFARLRESL
jgi:ribosomal-protein-alanine N-acetyltransferase